jgi:hypothetical protein
VINPKSQRGWFYFFAGVVAVGCAAYWYVGRYGSASALGHSGGSALGLTFGIAAAVLLLGSSIRRWLPPQEWWRRGHYWLGAMVVPLAWLHGGFHHGGPLTTAAMWLLYGVVVSGMLAALLGHFM